MRLLKRKTGEELEWEQQVREYNKNMKDALVNRVSRRYKPLYRGSLYVNNDGTIKGYLCPPELSTPEDRMLVQWLQDAGGSDANGNPMCVLVNLLSQEGEAFERTGEHTWAGRWWWPKVARYEYLTATDYRGRGRSWGNREVAFTLYTRKNL